MKRINRPISILKLSTRLRGINPTNTVFYSPDPRAEVCSLQLTFKITKLAYWTHSKSQVIFTRPSPRVCTDEGSSYGDDITKFSRLDWLPIFLNNGASLARWSSAINIYLQFIYCIVKNNEKRKEKKIIVETNPNPQSIVAPLESQTQHSGLEFVRRSCLLLCPSPNNCQWVYLVFVDFSDTRQYLSFFLNLGLTLCSFVGNEVATFVLREGLHSITPWSVNTYQVSDKIEICGNITNCFRAETAGWWSLPPES